MVEQAQQAEEVVGVRLYWRGGEEEGCWWDLSSATFRSFGAGPPPCEPVPFGDRFGVLARQANCQNQGFSPQVFRSCASS